MYSASLQFVQKGKVHEVDPVVAILSTESWTRQRCEGHLESGEHQWMQMPGGYGASACIPSSPPPQNCHILFRQVQMVSLPHFFRLVVGPHLQNSQHELIEGGERFSVLRYHFQHLKANLRGKISTFRNPLLERDEEHTKLRGGGFLGALSRRLTSFPLPR